MRSTEIQGRLLTTTGDCFRQRRPLNDAFFIAGNKCAWQNDGEYVQSIFSVDNDGCAEVADIADLMEEEEYAVAKKNVYGVPCAIASCPHTFTTMQAMEYHYEHAHGHQCTTCGTLYESERLLRIHYCEAHDTQFQQRLAQGAEQLSCLCCEAKFQSEQERFQHLQKEHQFPKWFRFGTKSRYCEKIGASDNNPTSSHHQNMAVKNGTVTQKKYSPCKQLVRRAKAPIRKLGKNHWPSRKFSNFNDSLDTITIKMQGLSVPGKMSM